MTNPLLARPWFRTTAISVVVAALVAGTMAVAWQLALARVPKHRAALERLVRAHTGLDVRFNELGLRWGWYGPEAVFRDVELGEPGRAATLLRAPELTVGFDAWRTMQTGQLRAGRVTLVAPEIDLVRPAAPTVRHRESAQQDFARVLHRWQGGRIDVESGTVRMALGHGSVALRIPRGTVRRSDDVWNASAQLLLPERLGRSARISLRLEGDPGRRETLSGRLRFDGERLALAGWRDLLGSYTPRARHLPASGSGNLELRATVRAGAFENVVGEIAADEVRLASLAAPISIGYLSGKWTAVRKPVGWRLDVTQLRAGVNGRDAMPAALALDLDPVGRRAHAVVDIVPLETLASAVQAVLPDISLSGMQIAGLAHGLELDWDATRPIGARLKATADASGVSLAIPSRGFSLANTAARLTASDTELAVDLEAPAAEVGFGGAHATHWNDVRLAARLLARLNDTGWDVSTERLIAEAAEGRFTLSGRVSAAADAEPQLSLRASLAHASLDAVRDLLFAQSGEPTAQGLPTLARGRIESGDLELVGALGAVPAGKGVERFRGSLEVRDASVAGTDTWPSLDGLDARVTWNGARMSAKVARGDAAGVQIAEAQADWRLDGGGPLRATGRAFGRIEHGLDWLKAHPQLQPLARNLHELDARGDALLDFRVTVPSDSPAAPRVRLALSLDGVRVVPGRALPAIDGLRGALVLENGRLHRSTLAGRWLGGPLSLRIAERRGGAGPPSIELRAQGLLDATQVARAAGVHGADRLSGQAAWNGTLTISRSEAGASLTGHAETTLAGVTSELPEPLTKSKAAELPLRIDVDARDSESPEMRVNAPNRLRGAFALALAADGWRIERGSLRIGAGDATLPSTSAFVLGGRVARLDLPAWLALGRASARDGSRAPLWAELVADEVDIAGRTFRGIELTAREDDSGLHVRTVSAALDGSLYVPHEPNADRPIDITLARLDLPSPEAAATAAGLVASLAPAARLRVDSMTWQGRQLGRMQAELSADAERVRIDSLRLIGGAHDLQGVVQCGRSLDACHLELEMTSADAAQALRDFALADDIHAQQARLTAELEWQRQPDRAWLASIAGRVGIALERGSVRSTQAGGATPFALFAMPALLGQDAAAATELPAGAAATLDFARLEGDYELRDGQAVTANLHFDGDAEILARGRVGLVDRDYDQVAWVLEGEERLPAAVRRFGATPRVAAAWLGLRDWFGGPEIADSRAVLHLHGSWVRPIVGAPVQEGVPQ